MNSRLNNPFVPIPRSYLLLVLFYFTVYIIITPTVKFFLIDTEVPYAYWRFTLYIIYQFLVFLPIIFYRNSYGLLHPLIFIILLDLVKQIMTGPGLLLSFFNTEPILQEIIISRGPLANQNSIESSELETTLLLLNILSIISIYMGYFIGIKWPTFQIPAWRPKQLNNITFIILVLSFCGSVYYIQSRGGLTAHFSTFGYGRESAVGGDGFIHALIRFGFLATIIWYAFKNEASKNPLFWIALAITIPTQFLLSGTRSSIIYSAIIVFMIYMLKTHKIPTIRVAMFAFIGVLIIGVLGELRKSTFGGKEVNWEILTSHDLESALEIYSDDIAQRKAAYPDITALALGVETTGLLWGKTYLGALLFFVPRAIWDDKPHSIGFYTGTLLYGSQGGKPPGNVVEAYWNFHIIGVFLVFFLYGTFLNWLARMLPINNHPAFHVIYVMILFYFGPGSLGTVGCFQKLSAVLIILWLVRAIPPRLKFNYFKF